MLSQSQKEMAERLAELLAQSTLDESVKKNILENLDRLPEEEIMKLVEVLETENDQLEKVVSNIETYLTEQESGWEKVEQEQKSFADEFVEKMAQALDDQAKIQELKDSI